MGEILNCVKKTIKYIHHNDCNSVHIGYGVDNSYARCAGTSIVSFCINNKYEIGGVRFSFHIVTTEMTKENLERFSLLAKTYHINIYIYILEVSYFNGLPTSNYFPTAIYFRLILPLIVENIDVIIYVDADIVCLNSILELINKFSLLLSKSNLCLVVPDVKNIRQKRIKALSLKNHIYFNSGFLVINIKIWKSMDIVKECLKILNKNRKIFTHPDQDALNILSVNKVEYLSPIYNCIDIHSVNKQDIVLLHFAANPKPWSICWDISPNCNDFNRDVYQYYEKKTPWANELPQKPRNYKEMEFYAKCLRRHKRYKESFSWYLKYLIAKLQYLLKI